MAVSARTEASRLALLEKLDILDSSAEPAFDALVRVASTACECPISLISLIDVDRQWFKAAVGLDATETPRDQAFCAHAIEGETLFQIPDATRDPRFVGNPLVTGEPGIRFYAGQPILYDGVALGTLCVIDQVPRELDEAQRATLQHLSMVLADLFHGRLEAILHRREAQRLHDFAHLSGEWLWESDALHRCTWLSGDASIAAALLDGSVVGERFRDLEERDRIGLPITDATLHTRFAREEPFADLIVYVQGNGGTRFLALTAEPITGGDGRFEGFRGSARDVTEGLQTQLEHEEREATLRKIAGQVPGVIYQFRLDPDGRACFPYASQGIHDTFEITPEDAASDARRVFERVHPDDAAALRASTTVSLDDGTIWHARFRVVLPVKGLRWLQGSSMPERLADGSTVWHGYITDVTESYARDRELLEAHDSVLATERRLRALTDHLPALISYVDQEQRYTYVNAHHHHIFGEDALKMIGRTMLEVRGAKTYASIEGPLLRALAGKTSSFEGSLNIDGSQRHYQGMFVPDFDVNGSVAGCYAMTFDLTQRKNAELRQAASERMLRGITDNLPALVCYVDNDNRYRFANAAYGLWFGIDHVTMIGRTVDEVFAGIDLEDTQASVARARAGERLSCERRATIDGQERYWVVDYVPDLDDNGHVVGIYAMTTDITSRREAELRVARSEKRMRNLTDALPVLISSIDSDGCVRYVNETFRRWVGAGDEDVIDRKVLDAVGPDFHERRREYLNRCLAGERIDFEVDSISTEGLRHLQTTYLPDFGPDGRVLGITTMSVDVTERIVAERRLSQLAHFDSLTELPNRLQFNNQLAEAFDADGDGLLVVMFLDIDHFKAINDTHGHAVGDRVLKEFAERVRQSLRATDFVARLAGDEFVVILRDLHQPDEIGQIAAKVVGQVDRPFRIGDLTLAITTSVGVALRDAGVRGPADMLAKADQALYRAKEAGRNTFKLAA